MTVFGDSAYNHTDGRAPTTRRSDPSTSALVANASMREALQTIRTAHAAPDQPGASCAEGCAGPWPCLAWSEADAALT